MQYQPVDIINIPTKHEAERSYKEFMSSVRKHNYTNTLWLLFAIALTIIIELLAYRFLNADLQVVTMIIVAVVGLIVIKVLLESYESSCRIFQPPAYLYNNIIESYQLLKAKMQSIDDEYVLVLDVADANGEVQHKFIYGFKKIEKVELKTATVDLATRKFYVPYKKEEVDGKD